MAKTQEVKPGIKTTELLVAILVPILITLNNYFVLGISEDSIVAITGLAVTYILSRTFVKAKK